MSARFGNGPKDALGVPFQVSHGGVDLGHCQAQRAQKRSSASFFRGCFSIPYRYERKGMLMECLLNNWTYRQEWDRLASCPNYLLSPYLPSNAEPWKPGSVPRIRPKASPSGPALSFWLPMRSPIVTLRARWASVVLPSSSFPSASWNEALKRLPKSSP